MNNNINPILGKTLSKIGIPISRGITLSAKSQTSILTTANKELGKTKAVLIDGEKHEI